MNCENCKNKITKKYGSGRFCSCKCARGFATKKNRKAISKKVSKTFQKKFKKILIKKKCLKCFKFFKTNLIIRKFCSSYCSRSYNWKIARKSITFSQRSKGMKNGYKNGSRQVSGGTTKWYSYKNIKVQGTYELRACKILDRWKKLGKIKDWEYTNDRYPYKNKNSQERIYLLDFKVFNDNTFYYVETKGYTTENDFYKWKAIKKLGYKLEIWNNDLLTKYEIGV